MAWALASLYWLLVGLAHTTDVYFFRPGTRVRPLVEVLASEMTLTVMWIPLTVLVFAISERFPLGRGKLATNGAVHGAACAGIIVVRAVSVFALDPLFAFYDTPPTFGAVVVHSVFNNLFSYWLQAGVAHAILLSRRERARQLAAVELQAELTRAQLHSLKAQLHPHFLFNTLHSISALVHEDAEAADQMIARLSELLRQVLDNGKTQTVSLDEELACLRPYVAIEQVRFGDRLTVVEEIEHSAREAQVPHLVLQPLVENAVRHGIAPRSLPGRVTVTARREGDRLLLEVSDDGVGMGAGGGDTSGLGLATTRARLRRLYGDAQALELSALPAGGVAAKLTLPFQRSRAEHAP